MTLANRYIERFDTCGLLHSADRYMIVHDTDMDGTVAARMLTWYLSVSQIGIPVFSEPFRIGDLIAGQRGLLADRLGEETWNIIFLDLAVTGAMLKTWRLDHPQIKCFKVDHHPVEDYDSHLWAGWAVDHDTSTAGMVHKRIPYMDASYRRMHTELAAATDAQDRGQFYRLLGKKGPSVKKGYSLNHLGKIVANWHGGPWRKPGHLGRLVKKAAYLSTVPQKYFHSYRFGNGLWSKVLVLPATDKFSDNMLAYLTFKMQYRCVDALIFIEKRTQDGGLKVSIRSGFPDATQNSSYLANAKNLANSMAKQSQELNDNHYFGGGHFNAAGAVVHPLVIGLKVPKEES